MTFPRQGPNPLDARAGLRRWFSAVGVSLGTAILVVTPFFWRGNASGHDIAFHASSWLDVAEQWKEGIVYPRWCQWANNGFGEPRFIFYPPLSWMLGAALGFVAPWSAVPGLLIVLAQTLGGISMFALARRFFSPAAAMFSAACYAGNPYALLVVYLRSDFAELLACALLPMLVLAAVELCGLMENCRRSTPHVAAIFAFLFACIWLSNAPAGVIASYSMALLFAWAAIRAKSLAPVWRGACGLTLGFGLAGFYLVPALYEQRWVNIRQALSPGLEPAQNFLYTTLGDPEHNAFNWVASSVAMLLMALTTIAALLGRSASENRDNGKAAGELWRVMALLGVAAAVLMIPPSSLLWKLLPELRFIQFPWRWTGIVAVPYAFFGAGAIGRARVRWIWASVVILAVAGTATFLVRKAWWDSDDIPVLEDAIASGQGFDGTDEYDPISDDHTDLPAKAPQVQILPAKDAQSSAPKAEIRIVRWTAEEKELSVTSPRPLRLAIRLLDYPAWRVEVNGQSVTPQSRNGTGQMILPLPAGRARIRLSFKRTLDRDLGNVLSGVSAFALLAALWGVAGRRSRPRLEDSRDQST
jgi:hypothetical protein